MDKLKHIALGDLINKLSHDIIQLGIRIATAVLVFYIGRWVIGRVYKVVHKLLEMRKVDPSLSTFVLSLINILLYFILVVAIISILGLETSSFLAIFASAGVAMGMALSGTLQNFAGGVLILLLKPYRVGDFIETQGFTGTVKEIQIFSTIINTADNKTIIIPNGGLSTGTINNWSRAGERRVDWDVTISYGDSVDDARRVLLSFFEGDPLIKRPVEVYVKQLADSSVVLTVRAWVNTDDYWPVFFRYNERIYTDLPRLSGISFPFPQLDVHLNGGQVS